jgi:adenylyltransferase/sulfurtransferase
MSLMPADNALPLEIGAHEAEALISAGNGTETRLIDCRDPDEFAFNRIAGAELIPLPTLPGDAAARLGQNRDARIVVYCHHGMRSARAAGILRALGYRNAQSLAGGIDRWSVEIDPAVPRY